MWESIKLRLPYRNLSSGTSNPVWLQTGSSLKIKGRKVSFSKSFDFQWIKFDNSQSGLSYILIFKFWANVGNLMLFPFSHLTWPGSGPCPEQLWIKCCTNYSLLAANWILNTITLSPETFKIFYLMGAMIAQADGDCFDWNISVVMREICEMTCWVLVLRARWHLSSSSVQVLVCIYVNL